METSFRLEIKHFFNFLTSIPVLRDIVNPYHVIDVHSYFLLLLFCDVIYSNKIYNMYRIPQSRRFIAFVNVAFHGNKPL